MGESKKFSIILPVRNGGEYVKQCVKSILFQNFADFNLEILENCSTDGTYEWLLGLQDSRIRIWPAESSLSIEENWKRILDIPKNEFMTAIGHDDLLDSNYLEVMSELINKYPDAGLYQTHFRLINEKGELIKNCFPMPERETPADFLASRMTYIRDSYGTGYMMRSRDYERVGGIPLYPKLMYADDALWLMLMESSWKATAREECFSYRLHSTSTSRRLDPTTFFSAFSEYVEFLETLKSKNKEIAQVINTYGSNYLLVNGRNCYQWMLEQACFDNKSLSNEYLTTLNDFINKFSPNPIYVENSKKIKFLETLNRTFLRKYVYKIKNFLKLLQSPE